MTDKQLIKQLKMLKGLEAGGRIQGSWVMASKEILMNQIAPQRSDQPFKEQAQASDSIYYWQYFNNLFKAKVLQPALATLVIAALMLTYSATVSVANASLPGDMLYPVKTTQEAVQLALAVSDEKKVGLQMEFTSRRVNELNQLVRKDDSRAVKVRKINTTAQQISANVKSVQDKLNKISMAAAPNSDVAQVAKSVDEKTFELKQGINEASAGMSEEVKKEVAKDIEEAIINTDNTGTSALGVIVDKYQKGETKISDAEVSTRVAERIKSTELDIEQMSNVVQQVATSTVAAVGQVLNNNTTSTLQTIIDKPQQAKVMIEEAKDLLDQKNFGSALDKIQESQGIVAEVTQTVNTITPVLPTSGQILGTTTTAVIGAGLTPVQATGTQETSESTKTLIKTN